MRRVALLVAATTLGRVVLLLAATTLGVVVATGVASGYTTGKAVRSVGTQSFAANASIVSTLKFAPSETRVSSGETVTWAHADQDTDPHSVTIVTEAQLPTTMRAATYDCFFLPGQSCGAAIVGHCGGPGYCDDPTSITPVIEASGSQPGLDAPGDSVYFAHNAPATATVSAPSGTTLHYLCAFHPWMQGVITVQ